MASSTSSCTLLFVDLPLKTFVGIDLVSFNSSPNFTGISNLLSGLHFLYTGTDASLSIRHGRWLDIPARSKTDNAVYTLQWSSEEESLSLRPQSWPGVAHSSRGLVDYSALTDATSNLVDQDALSTVSPTDFPLLSSHISPVLLSRILGSTWRISSISSSPRDSDAERIPGLTHLEASSALPDDASLHSLDIDLKRTWEKGDVGRVRTERARDRSWYLGHLIEVAAGDDGDAAGLKKREIGAKELLGEVQFCFLMVLTLANYSCLEQWKRLLTVMFTCKKAMVEVGGYFVEVIRILELQLRHADDVEGGLFELRDEMGSAWLRTLIERFGEAVRETVDKDSHLGRELEKFEKTMSERFGWEAKGSVLRRGMLDLEDGERVEVSMDGVDEDEERGEYAPVVVET